MTTQRNERLHNAIAALQGASLAMQGAAQLGGTHVIRQVLNEDVMRAAVGNLAVAVMEEVTREAERVAKQAESQPGDDAPAFMFDLTKLGRSQ